MSEPIMNNSMNNSTNNSTANAAYRAFFGLSKQASFIATLAASSIAFAQAPAAAPAATPASGNAQVKPTAGQAAAETFTIQFQDTDILQALQMLSMQGRRNIIASRGVQGKVSANLYDVGLFDALDVIMRANDLRLEESGNFIYVYTRQEWEDVTKSRLKKVSRNFPLEYLNAKDAGEFIGPILSEVGKVSFVGDVEKGFQPSATDGGSDSWAFQGMLVVSDYPENIKAIEALLKEIDTPPAQVIVESTVVSTDVQQNDGFGVDVSIIGNLSFSQFTNPLSGAQQLLNGSVQKGEGVANASNTNVTNIKDPTLQVGVISDDVSVFLKLLDSVTDTTVMALNRQRAQILIGQRTGYLNSTTTQTSTTQSVEFLDSGIKLIFRPFISSDGSIRMELAPSVSEATKSSTATVGGNTMEVPNESTSEIVTNVRVKNGQTLVLGGLFKEKTVIDRRQVPGLGDVPLIGNAFKGYNDDLHREEIIFLVTPTIVKDEIAKVWSDEAREFEHAVRIGAREGLLPWSRDTLTTAQNQKAFEAMGKGDRDLALFHCENSLRLSHNQPEMVRFREDLVGQGSTAQSDFERSMLRRMIQKQMDGAKQVTAESTATDAMDSAATDNAAGSANSGMDLGSKK